MPSLIYIQFNDSVKSKNFFIIYVQHILGKTEQFKKVQCNSYLTQ